MRFFNNYTKALFWGDFGSVWDIDTGEQDWVHPFSSRSAFLIQNEERVLFLDEKSTFSTYLSATGGSDLDVQISEEVHSCSISPDTTQMLVVVEGKNLAILYDFDRNEELHRLEHDQAKEHGALNGTKFNHDGSLILTYSNDETARLWNAQTGQLKQTINQASRVSKAMFNGDESAVITVDDVDARITILDSENSAGNDVMIPGGLPWQQARGLIVGEVQMSDLKVLDDGRLMTFDLVNSIQFWSAGRGEPENETDLSGLLKEDGWGKEEYLKFRPLPSSRLLVSTRSEMFVWDESRKRKLSQFDAGWSNLWKLNSDKTRLLTFSRREAPRMWDISSGKVLCELRHPPNPDATSDVPSYGSFGNKGPNVFTWRWEFLYQWTADGDLVHTYQFDHNVLEKGVNFTDDGSRMLVRTEFGEVTLWDVKSGEKLQRFNEKNISGSQISPDGSRVVTWSGPVCTVWDSESGDPIHRLRHFKDVLQAIFSADGKALYTNGLDKGIRVWDVDRGQVRSNLQTDGKTISMQLNESETTLLTAHILNEKEIYIWDLVSDQPLQSVPNSNPMEFPLYAGFDGDGDRILDFTKNGTLQSWPVGSSKPLPEDRVIERYQLRTGTKLNAAGRSQTLTFTEWLELSKQLNDD